MKYYMYINRVFSEFSKIFSSEHVSDYRLKR